MNRRRFLSLLAALPIVGKYWKEERIYSTVIAPTEFSKAYLDRKSDDAYIQGWVDQNTQHAIDTANRIEDMRLWRNGR